MLEGKKVFVSGGTGHIGAEICRLCSTYGATVIFSYHGNEDKARELAPSLKGGKAVAMDLRNVAGINEVIAGLLREVGPVDVLVNNAGVSHVMPLALVEEPDADLVFDANIKGTLFVTRALIKGMIRKNKGAIVNIGSIAGERMLDVPVTYAMSKAAMTGLTTSLAVELKKFNIRVNTVIPGLIDGGVGNGVPEKQREDFLAHCAVGRAGTAREVAEVVCFLASDRASYVNGQHLIVDGGI
jgi:NAD(P)-dependent dehydrogenase (short-subunit alcohol dehydrogenase family)